MSRRIIFAAFALSFAVFGLTMPGTQSAVQADEKGQAVAIFAGGCFWCVESDFDHVPGVTSTVSGYTGSDFKNPTYKTVSHGNTGHLEAVKITYDPSKVSYDQLLHVFWRSVDPTDAGGQFCDRGVSYQTAIYATNDEQLKLAKASKAALVKSNVLKAAVVTPVHPAKTFYPAEDYHQNYYNKSPIRYKVYRYRCGRDQRIRAVWGDMAHSGIKSH